MYRSAADQSSEHLADRPLPLRTITLQPSGPDRGPDDTPGDLGLRTADCGLGTADQRRGPNRTEASADGPVPGLPGAGPRTGGPTPRTTTQPSPVHKPARSADHSGLRTDNEAGQPTGPPTADRFLSRPRTDLCGRRSGPKARSAPVTADRPRCADIPAADHGRRTTQSIRRTADQTAEAGACGPRTIAASSSYWRP